MPISRELTNLTIQQIIEDFSPRGEKDIPDITINKYRIPLHQRHFIWSDLLQTTLIDTVMNNYPIPSIQLIRCIEKDGEGRRMFYNIEDGQQRLTTLYLFMKDKFGVEINGNVLKFSELTQNTKIQFLTYRIQCDIYDEEQITIEDRIKIFHRINSSKPLTDNQKFYSQMHSSQGETVEWVINKYNKQIHKYFGSIGKGSSRGLLSDIVGAIITLQRDDRSHLTTSYLKNSAFMDITREEESINTFLKAYFEILEEEVDKRSHKIRKSYGKLSGPFGLALCSWIEYNEIHDAISWYIGKKVDNKKYVPTSFKQLGLGDQRNCQGDSIFNRVKKIIEQYEKNEDDEGDDDSDDDE